MRFAVVAHRDSDTNSALVAAGASLQARSVRLGPRDALRLLDPGDVALGRLDVRETLDGIEDGTSELEKLAAAGVVVLNPSAALAATHDKLLTARTLRRAGLPHPRTWLIAEGLPAPVPELPVVLKPRFGSWGRDVTLCADWDAFEQERQRLWRTPAYRETGLIAQELVPPRGWDLRVVVAGGRVIGAARRLAAPAEWRTNVSLGGRSLPFAPPPLARSLAILAADAVHGDLVGVDLLPTTNAWVIAEVNGAVDFGPWYGEHVYENAALELVRVAHERRAAA